MSPPRPGIGRRIAVVGAFPFPYPQGSQIYTAQQTRALAGAGARPLLLTYGRGRGEAPRDLEIAAAARWLSPRALRSGPQWGKPVADAALLAGLSAAHRRERFDFVLAHNAEAAAIALAHRRRTGTPVVYVAHTILRWELPAYAGSQLAFFLEGAGSRIDRWLARSCDAVIALSREGEAALARVATGPLTRIPPGLDPAPAPTTAEQESACERAGVARGGFALYAGNLDGYQDLPLLSGAAARLRGFEGGRAPVLVATHEAGARGRSLERAGLIVLEVADFAEMRALQFAAGVLVLPRRRPGGFPVKLLNYMEAARPIVAFADVASDLRDDESARLLAAGAGASELAVAVGTLLRDPDRAARLGAGARRQLETEHDWPTLARRTLAFAERIVPG